MANERFNSQLMDEGRARDAGVRSVTATVFWGILLTLIGALVVWAFFLLLASA